MLFYNGDNCHAFLQRMIIDMDFKKGDNCHVFEQVEITDMLFSLREITTMTY